MTMVRGRATIPLCVRVNRNRKSGANHAASQMLSPPLAKGSKIPATSSGVHDAAYVAAALAGLTRDASSLRLSVCVPSRGRGNRHDALDELTAHGIFRGSRKIRSGINGDMQRVGFSKAGGTPERVSAKTSPQQKNLRCGPTGFREFLRFLNSGTHRIF